MNQSLKIDELEQQHREQMAASKRLKDEIVEVLLKENTVEGATRAGCCFGSGSGSLLFKGAK